LKLAAHLQLVLGLRMHKAFLLCSLHIFKEWFEEAEREKESDKKSELRKGNKALTIIHSTIHAN